MKRKSPLKFIICCPLRWWCHTRVVYRFADFYFQTWQFNFFNFQKDFHVLILQRIIKNFNYFFFILKNYVNFSIIQYFHIKCVYYHNRNIIKLILLHKKFLNDFKYIKKNQFKNFPRKKLLKNENPWFITRKYCNRQFLYA